MILLLQQGSNDFASFLCWIVPILLLILIIIIGVSQAKEQKAQKEKQNQKLAELKSIARTSVGKHLTGLPNIRQSSSEVECAIVDNNFLFFDAVGRELGKIPRDSVNQIIIDVKSQITQRLTATRIIALGVFALAAPKAQKHKTFCLVIDWDDNKGVRENTVFEFTGENSNSQANAAASLLRKYTKAKAERLKSDEKKCPYCAETIKREANICRFCKSELPEEAETIDSESANLAEEKVDFDVILQSIGSNKIGVIKVMREIKGFGLVEAKDFVESAPVIISHSVSRVEAEEISQILKEVGATVEIK